MAAASFASPPPITPKANKREGSGQDGGAGPEMEADLGPAHRPGQGEQREPATRANEIRFGISIVSRSLAAA